MQVSNPAPALNIPESDTPANLTKEPMTPSSLKLLAERCANESVVLSPGERERISDYLLSSYPTETIDRLIVVVDKLIRACEVKGYLKELCMNIRVRIATLTLKWKTLRYTIPIDEDSHNETLEDVVAGPAYPHNDPLRGMYGSGEETQSDNGSPGYDKTYHEASR